jgi:anti-sigma factor RsiW
VSAAPPTDVTCRELVELVTEYLDRTLPPPERARFERHVASCAGCAAHVRQLRAIVRAAGRLSERSIPDEARDRLLLAFRGWKRGRPPA